MIKGRVAGLFCAGILAFGGAAGEEPKLGWSDQADLSYVLTAGNSESTTLGLKNELKRTWEKSLFTFKVAAIRAESTTFVRTAIGTPTATMITKPRPIKKNSIGLIAAANFTRRRFWSAYSRFSSSNRSISASSWA